MKTHKISDFLIRQKDVIEIEDHIYYKRLTIKTNNQGVSLRDEEIGTNIGTKKQFIAKGGQFIVSKIDAMNGAFGIIPSDIKEAIITGNFWTYDVNTSLVNIDWFNMFVSLPNFIKLCEELSSGTTHRKYLDENKFSNYVILLPDIDEQNIIVENYIKHKALSDSLLYEISKQEKYVSSLRQAILQQAVVGKLCKQDPSDEPASVLLEKIRSEKDKLIAEKKFKKQKDLPPITEEEKPFELPQGWEWCRLGDITQSISTGPFGSVLHKRDYVLDGIPLVNPKNIINNSIVIDSEMMVNAKTRDRLSSYVLNTGDLVIGRRGKMGRCALVKPEQNGFLCGTGCFFISFIRSIDLEFILKVFTSPFIIQYLEKESVGSTMNNLNHRILNELYIPLPPLAEQQRIVEKVDRLMVLCGVLEQEIVNSKRYALQLMEAVLQEAFGGRPQTKHNNITEITAVRIPASKPLMAAARGKMRDDTWERIRNEAVKLASEES